MNSIFRAMISQAERLRQTGMEHEYRKQLVLAEEYAGRSNLLAGDVEGKTATEEKLLFEAERSLGRLQFDLGIEEQRSVFAMSDETKRAAIAFDRDLAADGVKIKDLFVA